MLKALLLFLMNLALAGMAMAQNLVLNGSFEDTVNCDMPVIGIRKAAHWYTANSASPDVWDADLERECGFPLDPVGFPGWWYITPFEGLRHAGGFYWSGPDNSNTRDYVMTRLSAPMVSGQSYEVSLGCALSGTYEFAVDHVGVWFGEDSLYEAQPNWLHVTPQLKLRDPAHTYLNETEAWTLLTDTLVANGGEQWMVIGNFDMPDEVNGISAYPDALNEQAYYYLDSVVVRPVDDATGVDGHRLVVNWSTHGLWIEDAQHRSIDEVCLFDARGRVVLEVKRAASERLHLLTPPLASGLYIARVSIGGRWFSKKLIRGEGGL